jgi:hypothetical protein
MTEMTVAEGGFLAPRCRWEPTGLVIPDDATYEEWVAIGGSLAQIHAAIQCPNRLFWSKAVRSEGCWEWSAARSHYGYGKLTYLGRSRIAHRMAWEFAFGPIPAGLFVLHHCDNPPCVRPDHLFLGTQADNIRDKISKGRGRGPTLARVGEANGRAKLNSEQVRTIRERYAAGGISQRLLGREYGLSQQTISYVVRADTWTR